MKSRIRTHDALIRATRSPLMKGKDIVIAGSCLVNDFPKEVQKFANSRPVFSMCLEMDGPAGKAYGMLANHLATAVASPTSIDILTVDSAPYCYQIHAAFNEAYYIASKDRAVVLPPKNHSVFLQDTGEIIKINADTIRLARYLSLLEELVNADPRILEGLATCSTEYKKNLVVGRKEMEFPEPELPTHLKKEPLVETPADLIETFAKSRFLQDADVLIVGTCLLREYPRLVRELSKNRIVLSNCPEKDLPIYGKLASMIRSAQKAGAPVRSIVGLSMDCSPHCLLIQTGINEAYHMLGITSADLPKKHYVCREGKFLEVSENTLRIGRYLSLVQKLLEKHPGILDKLRGYSLEYWAVEER